MKNKFGQTQSAYTLLVEAYQRVLLNMGRKQAISTGALLAAMMAAGAPAARAATYTWDTTADGAIQEGGGTWATATRNWSKDSNGVSWSNVPAGSSVQFGAGGAAASGTVHTVLINQNLAVEGITFGTFGNGRYTLQGDGTAGTATLTIGAGGITDNSNSGEANTGGIIQNGTRTVNILLGADQTWQSTVAGRRLTVSSAVDNGGHLLTVAGAGQVNLVQGVTGAGGLTKNGTGTLYVGQGQTGLGAVNVTAGTLIFNVSGTGARNNTASVINIADSATLQLRGNLDGNNALNISGPINVAAGGTLRTDTGATPITHLNGLVTLSGSTVTAQTFAGTSAVNRYSLSFNGGVKVDGGATGSVINFLGTSGGIVAGTASGNTAIKLGQSGGTVFDVGSGAAVDLKVEVSLSTGSNGGTSTGLIKKGTGVMQLTNNQLGGDGSTKAYGKTTIEAGHIIVGSGGGNGQLGERGYSGLAGATSLFAGTSLTFNRTGTYDYAADVYTTDASSIITVGGGLTLNRTGVDVSGSHDRAVSGNESANLYNNSGSWKVLAGNTLQYSGAGRMSDTSTYSLDATTARLVLNHGGTDTVAVAADISGSGQLVKSGTSHVVLTRLNLTGAGTGLEGATTLNGGTLTLDYGTQDSSMLSDDAGLFLNGGTLILRNGTHVETVARTAIGTGTVYFNTQDRTLTETQGYINLGELTTNASGTLVLQADKQARITGLNGGTVTPGIVSGVFMGLDQVKVDADGWLIANTDYEDVPYDGSIPDGFNGDGERPDIRLVGGPDGQPVTLAAAVTTINTLNNRHAADKAATVINMEGKTLRLGEVGAITTGGLNSGLVIGAAANDGFLTAGGDSNPAETPAASILFNVQDPHFIDSEKQAGTNAVKVNAVIQDNGATKVSLKLLGSGTVIFAGNNTYTGALDIESGTLQVGDGGTTGTLGAASSVVTLKGTGPDMANGSANLIFNRSGSFAVSNVIASTSVAANNFVTKTGAGNLTLSGNNTFKAGITINDGTLTVAHATGLGDSANNVLNNAALVFTNSAVANVAGVISGGGTLTRQGAGETKLGANNTYTGVTTISGPVATSILSVSNLAVGASSSLGNNAGAAGDLILNGGTLKYTGEAVTTARQFTLTQLGGKIDASGAGALNLSSAGALATSGSGLRTFRLGGTNAGNNIFAKTLSDVGISATSFAKEDGGRWILTGNNDYTGTTSNTGGANGTGFGSTIGGAYAGSVSVRNSSVGDGELLVGNGGAAGALGSGAIDNQSSLVYNRTDAGTWNQDISGDGTVANNRNVTLNLGGNNSGFTGGTLAVAGTNTNAKIVANSNTAFGANNDAYINTNAALDFNGHSFTLGGLNNGANGGGTLTTGAGILTVGGNNNDGYFSGTITTTNGLNKIGRGFQTIASNQSFTGGVVLTNVSGSGTGVLQVGGGGTTGNLGTNAVTVNANTALAFNRSDTFTFSNLISGAGGIIQNGTGTTNLSNTANAFTGTVTINRGTLADGSAAGNPTAFGTGVVVMNGGKLDTFGAGGVTYTIAGIDQGGATYVASTGEILKGPTAVNAGQLGAIRATGTQDSVVDVHGNELIINMASGTVANYSGTIAGLGGGTLVIQGGTAGNRSKQVLSGDSTYTGSTTVKGDTTLQIGDGNINTTGSIQSAIITVEDAASNLTIARFGSVTLGSAVEGAGSLTQHGGTNTARTILTGTSSYTGLTNVNRGVLQVGNGGTGGSLTGTSGILIDPTAVGQSAGFEYKHGDDTSLTVPITVGVDAGDDARLIFSGSGTTTLQGQVAGTGTTRIGGVGGEVVLDYSTGGTSRLSDKLELAGGRLTLKDGAVNQVLVSTIIGAGVFTEIARTSGTSTINLGAVTLGAGATVGISDEYTVRITSGLTNNATSGLLDCATVGEGRELAMLSDGLDVNGANWIVKYGSGYEDVSYAGGGATRPNTSVIRDVSVSLRGQVRLTGNEFNLGAAGYITVAGLANTSVAGGAATEVTTIDNILNRHLREGVDTNNPVDANNPGDTTIDLAANQALRLGSAGRIISASDTGDLTVGSVVNQGYLTAGGDVASSSTNNLAGTLTVQRFANTTGARTLINAKVVDNGTGVVSFAATSGGLVTLAGTNTYTGSTTVGSATTLQLGDGINGGATGSIAGASLVTLADNSVLSFNRNNAMTITNNIVANVGERGTIRQDGNGTTTYAGTGITGQVDTVVNAGTLVISTNDSSTGATQVNAGTLVINTTHGTVGTYAGNYTVGNGGGPDATLAGNGTINVGTGVNGGTIAVDAVDGHITAGSNADAGTIGTLRLMAGNTTIAGVYDVDLNTDASLSMATAPGVKVDYLQIDGDVDLTGMTLNLRGADSVLPAAGTHYAVKLLSWTGNATGAVADGANVTALSGLALRSDQSIVRWGNAYYLVPEPASFALLGLGSLLLLRRPTRRRGRAAGAQAGTL